jgi:hypothetical protein
LVEILRVSVTHGFFMEIALLSTASNPVDPGSTACDKFSSQEDSQFPSAEELPPRAPSEDFPKECVLCPLAAKRNRTGEGA